MTSMTEPTERQTLPPISAADQITALGNAMHPVSEWPQPKFPEPVDAPVPAWATREPVDAEAPTRATRVYGWLWVSVDDVWERTVRRPFRWADAGGFDVASIQNASADGTVTTPPPEIWLDLEGDMIDNAADARQLGQWLIEAADVLDRIEGGAR